MKPTISLVMIVKNEEAVLKRCLDSAVENVDEIVIVDTGSTDRTKLIAADYKAKIFDYQWNHNFADARNFALEQSTTDWCMILDADEFIINECKDIINAFIADGPQIGRVKHTSKFISEDGLNYEHCYISRIIPSYCRYVGNVHEQIQSDLPRVKLNVEIMHDGYMETQKHDRNIPLLQKAIEEHPDTSYYYYQIAKEYRGLGDAEKEFNNLKKAYKLMDHKETISTSIIVNYMYAIISSGNLKEGLAVFDHEEKFMGHSSDFYFVSALFFLELMISDPQNYQSILPNIEQLYKKALDVGDTGEEGNVRGTGSFAAHHNLGVFYELTGNIQRAIEHYQAAVVYNYEPSLIRLYELKV
ncbi:glycosyltransferase [Paenibacillus polymyxa]|jgi:glycosyltransferase involved in cell wall biosynthesis|uniref:tetratricopeptide repeat-containing glycosyltransferase family 2 protein n=1 Tax=Paenibacillus TaxID=44249 RepID=UPI000D318F93|nr:MULTISPECIES: glycosyltransferase family 2 protein [Paenibacillus]KAF6621128.1 glycosyltransferase [Paenibacillus sp. EKM101P]KAF6622432.1 glycosyltransferase [Paenibacillus sp. EKM102P]KAF6632281.1 glycosyltransferase [Paenibacillus sp. EKM10P]KAF6647036.1 glycosyltransferase [Paenibacillus sp. EKM11P]MBY0022369.1 glycosyltransferase [Paenibacillus polymyxa]